MKRRTIQCLLAGAAIVLAFLLHVANLFFGDLNQDEGWYLYAARQIASGLLPYRDFHFSQSPLLPFLYALLAPLWDGMGVAGGRLLTACLGFLSAVLAACLVSRLALSRIRFHAALTCFALVAVNIYQSYFTTIVKTYSLTAFFLCAGFLALSFAPARGGLWAAAASGILLACAAGSRLSAGAALPVAGVYLVWQHRRIGHPWAWLVFGLAAGAALAALFLPWLILAPEGFRFGLSLHADRNAGDLLSRLLFKAGFLSRFVRAYYLPLLLGAAAAVWIWIIPREPRKHPESNPETLPFAFLLAAAVTLISAIHFFTSFPYDDYQVPVFPLLAVLVSFFFWWAADRTIEPADTRLLPEKLQTLLLLAMAAAAFSSPINQEWFVRGRDRFWWLKKEKSDLRLLQETAAWIRHTHPAGGVLLTQDTYLAVEAGWDVPPGLEMGPFCYFPHLTTENARQFKVLNRELLTNLLATTEAPLAAFSGYGLAITAPEMTEIPREEQECFWQIVRDRYERVRTVPDFGQAHTTLTLWKRKASPDESSAGEPRK